MRTDLRDRRRQNETRGAEAIDLVRGRSRDAGTTRSGDRVGVVRSAQIGTRDRRAVRVDQRVEGLGDATAGGGSARRERHCRGIREVARRAVRTGADDRRRIPLKRAVAGVVGVHATNVDRELARDREGVVGFDRDVLRRVGRVIQSQVGRGAVADAGADVTVEVTLGHTEHHAPVVVAAEPRTAGRTFVVLNVTGAEVEARVRDRDLTPDVVVTERTTGFTVVVFSTTGVGRGAVRQRGRLSEVAVEEVLSRRRRAVRVRACAVRRTRRLNRTDRIAEFDEERGVRARRTGQRDLLIHEAHAAVDLTDRNVRGGAAGGGTRCRVVAVRSLAGRKCGTGAVGKTVRIARSRTIRAGIAAVTIDVTAIDEAGVNAGELDVRLLVEVAQRLNLRGMSGDSLRG